MLEITKIIDLNQADYTWFCVCCLFFGSQIRLVNYFELEIVRSLSAYFGKTWSEIGYWEKSNVRVEHIYSKAIIFCDTCSYIQELSHDSIARLNCALPITKTISVIR